MRLTSILVVAVLVVASVGAADAKKEAAVKPNSAEGTSGPLTNGFYNVSRVVDGDTIIIRNARGEITRVRIIGVDTPETVKPDTPPQPFGREATEYTKLLISESRSRVRVELDGPTTDKYQRALAHIYVTSKGNTNGSQRELLVSEELLRSGLGRAMLNFPFSDAMKSRLHAAETEAKEQHRNLWSGSGNGVL
ncbi:MAG: thermonuclease family protein [Thermoguttaceae bacterium]